MWTSGDTIAAISTPPGEGGIGIVRLSGDHAEEIARKVLLLPGCRTGKMQPRQVYYGSVIEPLSGRCIDEVISFYFAAPHSYTGEDVVEIQTHGGIVVVQRVLQLLLQSGALLATAGEFTKRAFLSGRLDLTQAEAVRDLIQADGAAGAAQAMAQLSGLLGRRIGQLTREFLHLIAVIEVSIDFPDDYEPLDCQEFDQNLAALASDLQQLLVTADQGRILRQGLKVVIVGRPNVGKSSLLNSLLGEDRAIVTAIAGTTRDVLEERFSLDGIVMRLVDTAGLHESADEIEQLGMVRTRAAIDTADLVLWVLDAKEALQAEDRELAVLVKNRPLLLVINKTDLADGGNLRQELRQLGFEQKPIAIAAALGEGLEDLLDAIRQRVLTGRVTAGNEPILTNLRHKDAVEQALRQVEACQQAVAVGLPEDCYVIHLRSAYEALAAISGELVSEDIIDTIFSQFCVGK